MKKNLVKKIVSISVVALVLALVITTIVLALVPKKFENPIVDGYATITVYKNGVSQQYTYSENPDTEAERSHNEVYKKIQNLHVDSLKDNLLSAIFQGTGSFEVRVEKEYISNVISTVASAEDTNCLVFTYLQDEQQVLKIDGEVYNDENTRDDSITFDMIVMPLGTEESFEECTIYLASRTSKACSYQVKFLAHQSELNEYVSGLDFGLVA